MGDEIYSIIGIGILIIMDAYLIYRLLQAGNNRHRNALIILFITVNILASIVFYLKF